MTTYTQQFDDALNHAMLYEVGGFWKLTPEVAQGLCGTAAQKKATGYVNDPADAGGETKFGVAKNANPTLNIKTLTWEDAKAVYFKKYWLAAACDKLPPKVAIIAFDGAINHGVGRATKFLQQAAGVLVDGNIGPVSLAKIASMDQDVLCNKIADLRVKFYKDIVAAKPSQAKFLNGWLRRIDEVRAFVLAKK